MTVWLLPLSIYSKSRPGLLSSRVDPSAALLPTERAPSPPRGAHWAYPGAVRLSGSARWRRCPSQQATLLPRTSRSPESVLLLVPLFPAPRSVDTLPLILQGPARITTLLSGLPGPVASGRVNARSGRLHTLHDPTDGKFPRAASSLAAPSGVRAPAALPSPGARRKAESPTESESAFKQGPLGGSRATPSLRSSSRPVLLNSGGASPRHDPLSHG